jgi:hypothetical protein
MGLFEHLPNPAIIDARVRAELADSLAYIFGQAKDHLEVDDRRFHLAIEQIRLRKQHPGVFADHFHLISAINASHFATATTLLAELIERTCSPVSFDIVPFTKEEIGSDYERFPELLFAEFSNANSMASPSPRQSARSTEAFREAIAIISRIDNRIHDEVHGFLSRLYLAIGNKDPLAKPFGGVTSLMVWGASFVNVEVYKSRWDAVQFLVHEITHSLLFGLSSDEPLVLNLAEEKYKSPLRSDQRPMDGIFHATIVCARLAAFNRDWANSGFVGSGDRDFCEKAAASNAQRFRDGAAVIRQHGKLSELGRRLVDQSDFCLAEFA